MLIEWFLSIKSLPNLLFGVLCLPGDQSHPVCATDNKPSCVLHLLGWFIGSRGFPPWNKGPNFGSYKHMSMFFVRKKANFKIRRALVADNFSTQRTLSSSNVSERRKKKCLRKIFLSLHGRK